MSPYKWLVGIVLTAAMLTVLGASALVFAARDFQYGVAQVAPSTNGLISVERLVQADALINQIETESAGPRGELLEIEQEISNLDTAVSNSEAQVNDARTAIVGNIAEIETRANIATTESAAASIDTSSLTARVQSLAARPGLGATDQQAVASLQNQIAHLAELEGGVDTRGAQRAELAARQRLVGGQVAESNRRIFALQQSVVPDYEHYARVRGEVFALRNLSPMGVSASLAQGHPALLSTALVLLMGGLGALLYLFPAYLTRPVPVTIEEIVVRLIFGACAALAFYVLANATIAGFSFTSEVRQATTSAALNPFTVSLIGIVAGVLAEDIAKWIQDRGRGIFTQGGAPIAPSTPTATTTTTVTTEDVGFTGINPHGGPGAP